MCERERECARTHYTELRHTILHSYPPPKVLTPVSLWPLCLSLLFSTEPGEPPCITSSGFQFLLLDTSSQLWYFMLQYLQSAEVTAHNLRPSCSVCPPVVFLTPCLSLHCSLQTRGMDLVEILSFLFQLSFSTLGKVRWGRAFCCVSVRWLGPVKRVGRDWGKFHNYALPKKRLLDF